MHVLKISRKSIKVEILISKGYQCSSSGPPDAPTGPMETSNMDRTVVDLTWKPPASDGGAPVTGYIVERREPKRTEWTKLDSTKNLTLTVRNLIEGNDYFFRVCAENEIGKGEWLEMDKVHMKGPFGKIIFSDFARCKYCYVEMNE